MAHALKLSALQKSVLNVTRVISRVTLTKMAVASRRHILSHYDRFTPWIHTLYNVCAVPWGCSVPWGDIMSTVGDILSTVGGVQYCGGYHDKCGGISWVPWRVFSTVGDIMSTVEGVQYRGGIPSFEIWVPWGISWCMWGDIMSTVGVFSTVGYSNNNWLFPPWYWTPSMVLMIFPHMHHDIPHSTEHPPWYSR